MNDLYGELYKFVIDKTFDYLCYTMCNEPIYLHSEKHKRTAKILYELSSRLIEDTVYDIPTPYTKELETLIIQTNQVGVFFAFYKQEKLKDGSVRYTPLCDTPQAKRYHHLKKLEMLIIMKREAGYIEMFHKYLKQFNDIVW